MIASRRAFIFGAASLLAAPAIVRADSLMKIVVPKKEWLIQWGPTTVYAEGLPPYVMDAIAADIARVNAHIVEELHVDLWQAYTAIKAPPRGFRLA